MPNTKVDLTKFCTIKEIQYILLESEEYRGNIILKDLSYQKQIIEYVLSNLNHRYTTIENLTEIPKKSSDILPHCPIQEQTIIRQLIQLKMSEIVRQLLEPTQRKANNKVKTLR